MTVKEMKEKIEKVSDDTELLLWEWDGEKGSLYYDLHFTLQPSRVKGYLLLSNDPYIPRKVN